MTQMEVIARRRDAPTSGSWRRCRSASAQKVVRTCRECPPWYTQAAPWWPERVTVTFGVGEPFPPDYCWEGLYCQAPGEVRRVIYGINNPVFPNITTPFVATAVSRSVTSAQYQAGSRPYVCGGITYPGILTFSMHVCVDLGANPLRGSPRKLSAGCTLPFAFPVYCSQDVLPPPFPGGNCTPDYVSGCEVESFTVIASVEPCAATLISAASAHPLGYVSSFTAVPLS